MESARRPVATVYGRPAPFTRVIAPMSKTIRKLGEASAQRDVYGQIFELAGTQTGLPMLSFAWVVVDPRATSPAAYHKVSSELYHIVEGQGIMVLDGQEHAVGPGDCISIAPGTIHFIRNASDDPLCFFVATSPSYDPDDDIEVEVGAKRRP